MSDEHLVVYLRMAKCEMHWDIILKVLNGEKALLKPESLSCTIFMMLSVKILFAISKALRYNKTRK